MADSATELLYGDDGLDRFQRRLSEPRIFREPFQDFPAPENGDGDKNKIPDNGNKNELTRIVTWQIDPSGKSAETVDIHAFNGKFSRACGSAQRVDDSVYVISFGAATKDNEYMAVIDFATGEKLLSITLDNPQDFTYRCVYYE